MILSELFPWAKNIYGVNIQVPAETHGAFHCKCPIYFTIRKNELFPTLLIISLKINFY